MIGIGWPMPQPASSRVSGEYQRFSDSRRRADGAKSQLTGVVGAAVIVAMLIALPSLFADLPQPALGLSSSRRRSHSPTSRLPGGYGPNAARTLLHRGHRLPWCGHLRVLPGIVIAIAISVANVFRRVWWPHQAVLGKVPHLAGSTTSPVIPTPSCCRDARSFASTRR